jgi:histidyl-tRNA synthetase
VDQAAVRFDPTIVRGLEYYTGAVFEAELLLETTDEKGRAVRFGSIGGGGRYDDLVARFTGEATPATGFSFGVSRLASALRAAGRNEAGTRGPVVVIVFDEADMQHYLDAVAELRRSGIAAELYLGRAGLKAQMKYADRRSAPAAVMLGGNEIAAGQVTIKDLDVGRALAAGLADNEAWKAARPGQQTVARRALVSTIRTIIEGSSIT